MTETFIRLIKPIIQAIKPSKVEKEQIREIIKKCDFLGKESVYGKFVKDKFIENDFYLSKKFKAPLPHIEKMIKAIDKLNGAIVWNDFRHGYLYLNFNRKKLKVTISKFERILDPIMTIFSFAFFCLAFIAVILLIPEIENPKTFVRIPVSFFSTLIMGYLFYMTALPIKKAKKLERAFTKNH
ncbi:MAG: hypothetical protein GQ574_04145 [Crocinitomix sp.]|nr:hypothetical protein [Crocinitomix sp.]